MASFYNSQPEISEAIVNFPSSSYSLMQYREQDHSSVSTLINLHTLCLQVMHRIEPCYVTVWAKLKRTLETRASTPNNAPNQMIRICTRARFRSSTPLIWKQLNSQRAFSQTQWRKEDPRLDDYGRKITDEFAEMRAKYGTSRFIS